MKYGVVQGRLLPQEGTFVQSFPRTRWLEEFQLASTVGCNHIEWIVTAESLEWNPMKTLALFPDDFRYIKQKFNVSIDTLCYDAILDPEGAMVVSAHAAMILRYVYYAADVGISRIVLPLLEGASIRLPSRRNDAYRQLERIIRTAKSRGVAISLETDLDADELVELLKRVNVGITLDTGNLARLGYKLDEHVDAYCDKVDNMHIKDCVRGGTSVPLGSGDVGLGNLRYAIEATGVDRVTFQTARSEDTDSCTDLELFKLNRNIIEDVLQT